jgi:hypothetical protein
VTVFAPPNFGPRRCGHDRRNPVLVPVWENDGNGIPLLERALEGCPDIFWWRGRRWPERTRRRYGRPSKRLGTVSQIRYVERDNRSDAAEADTILMAFFFAHCDVATLEVGEWVGGKVEPFFRETISRATGLHLERLDEAISRLRAYGWIHRHQGREKDGDEWETHAARTWIKPEAFLAHDIALDWMEQQREIAKAKRRKHLEQTQREQEASRAAEAAALMRPIIAAALKSPSPRTQQEAPYNGFDNENDSKRYVVELGQLMREHPEWSRERQKDEARRRVRPPPTR